MNTETTTTSFIEELQAGSPEAWRKFERIHVPVIYTLCKTAMKDESAGRKLTEKIISIIREKIGSFKRQPNKRFRSYIKQITFSKISELRRKNYADQKRLERSEFFKLYDELELRRVIAELKTNRGTQDSSWEMFHLHYEKKKTFMEIALQFGVKEESVQRIVRRVRRMIESEMDLE